MTSQGRINAISAANFRYCHVVIRLFDLKRASTAPVAEKIPHVMTLHGVTRTDDYYWLRDDERKDPKVLAHLEAENRYTAAYFKPLKPLQDGLLKS